VSRLFFSLNFLSRTQIWNMCNQKKRVQNTHNTLAAFNEPRCPCPPDLLHTYRPPIFLTLELPTDFFVCTLQIKDIQAQQHNKPHSIPSHASPIHTDASQGNSHIALQTMYIPRKHKLAFHQMFTKLQTSLFIYFFIFFSLSHSFTATAWPITRRSGKFWHSAKIS
jgi:hypothetical protein